MRHLICVVVAAALIGCGGRLRARTLPLSGAPDTRLMSGTPVPVVPTSRIRTGNDSARMTSLTVAADVVDGNGVVVLPQGSPVDAEIFVRHPPGFGRPGRIAIQCHGARTREGWIVPLTGTAETQGRRYTGTAVGLGIGLMFVMGPFAWFFFKKRGGHAAIEAGATIPCRVR